jgi:hypothetical protein
MELSNYILWVEKIDSFLRQHSYYSAELDMPRAKRTRSLTPPRFQVGRAPSKKEQLQRRNQKKNQYRNRKSGLPSTTPSKTYSFLQPTNSFFQNVAVAPTSYYIAAAICGRSLTARNSYVNSVISGWRRLCKDGYIFEATLPFKVPKTFQTHIQDLRIWLKAEIQAKYNLQRFVYHWLRRRYGGRLLNTDDPWTLCSPSRPICIYDAQSRGTYTFDAASLQKSIDSALGYTSWLFPEPKMPTNPLTNLPFHLGQLFQIVSVLRVHGYSSWLLEAFRDSKYSLKQFGDEFRIPIKLRGLADCMKNPANQDTYEMLQDFIEEHSVIHTINDRVVVQSIYWGAQHKPLDPYIHRWRTVWNDFMRNIILHGPTYYDEHPLLRKSLRQRTKQLFESSKAIEALILDRTEWLNRQDPPIPFPTVAFNFTPFSSQGIFNLQELLATLNAEVSMDDI